MNRWWDDLQPIVELEGDGQTMTWIYARKHRGQWEYAVVTFSDGDGPVEGFISAVVLKRGLVEPDDEGAAQ